MGLLILTEVDRSNWFEVSSGRYRAILIGPIKISKKANLGLTLSKDLNCEVTERAFDDLVTKLNKCSASRSTTAWHC